MIVNFPHRQELPACTGGEVQTRSESTGLVQHPTFLEAVKRAWEDKSVWKISYQTEEGWKRFVIR